MPAANPTRASAKPPPSTRRSTVSGRAPSASRIPNSPSTGRRCRRHSVQADDGDMAEWSMAHAWKLTPGGLSNGRGKRQWRRANEAAIETVIDVPDELTSQSRHRVRLSGSPPRSKLLIPLEPHPGRRDVRVVEGARLESEARQRYRGSSKRANTHAISGLSSQNYHAMCVRKPPCSWRF
jgi:hypothetical protein